MTVEVGSMTSMEWEGEGSTPASLTCGWEGPWSSHPSRSEGKRESIAGRRYLAVKNSLEIARLKNDNN